ncbi:acetyl-CoA acetyltransferase [Robiginitalea biformata HTCC2501]|uniref:Acetyl-CoA acetyltransferase n=1 Tax=Robiginitalea biformata (strain ATCC BAA-864 / DSM 15991 / KCTC 12146 / HTCC2501) TaxID=313596 RepID=A4CNM6_ROBBH|nr:acetyl-CoA acetyltransferase [Robiginitalea biformata HTCC2501]
MKIQLFELKPIEFEDLKIKSMNTG